MTSKNKTISGFIWSFTEQFSNTAVTFFVGIWLARLLTPRECARLQGFPENFIIDAVSKVQNYRQFGNSVSVPVVRAVATQLQKYLE